MKLNYTAIIKVQYFFNFMRWNIIYHFSNAVIQMKLNSFFCFENTGFYVIPGSSNLVAKSSHNPFELFFAKVRHQLTITCFKTFRFQHNNGWLECGRGRKTGRSSCMSCRIWVISSPWSRSWAWCWWNRWMNLKGSDRRWLSRLYQGFISNNLNQLSWLKL